MSTKQIRVKAELISELRKMYNYPNLSDTAIVNMALLDMIRARRDRGGKGRFIDTI